MTAFITDEIDRIESLISTARKLLSKGEMSDISSLEKRVHNLSVCLNAKNHQDGHEFLPRIDNIIHDMDNLACELKNTYGWLCLINSPERRTNKCTTEQG